MIDLSGHALGHRDDPLGKTGIRVLTADERRFKPHISEQYGIRGLALSGKDRLRSPNAVGHVDVLVAHFGRPPTIKANGPDRQVVSVTADASKAGRAHRADGHVIEDVEIDAPEGRCSYRSLSLGARGDGQSDPSHLDAKRSRQPSKGK